MKTHGAYNKDERQMKKYKQQPLCSVLIQDWNEKKISKIQDQEQ